MLPNNLVENRVIFFRRTLNVDVLDKIALQGILANLSGWVDVTLSETGRLTVISTSKTIETSFNNVKLELLGASVHTVIVI